MRIEELHLKNFRCFKELDIKFPASNLAVFIGLNGSGKTAILDIIALYLDMKLIITETPKSSGFSRQCNLDDISIGSEYTENKILINYGNQINLWEDTYFKDKTKNNYRPINNLYFRAVNDDRYICLYYSTNRKEIYAIYEMRAEYTNFDDFDKWFEEAENFENALKLERKNFEVTYVKLDVVRKAIETFFSSISGVQFSELKIKRIIINKEIFGSYKDEIEQHSSSLVIQYNGEELKLSQLSEGQRLLLHLVGDIAFRLTNDDKNLDAIDFDDQSNAVNAALQSKGIILIDEIELQLHPQWQREVLPALQKTFPNIQFIVTTHSPQVLSNVKKENIFILEDGKVIENTPHTEGRDVNSILYELFGVEERPKSYKDKINKLYNALDDENIVEAKEILAELTALFGEQDTEIVKANLHLSFASEE